MRILIDWRRRRSHLEQSVQREKLYGHMQSRQNQQFYSDGHLHDNHS